MMLRGTIMAGFFLVLASLTSLVGFADTQHGTPVATELSDSQLASVYGGSCGLLCLPSGTGCPTPPLPVWAPPVEGWGFAYTSYCTEVTWRCYIDLTAWCEEMQTNCSYTWSCVMTINGVPHPEILEFVGIPCPGTKDDCEW